MVYLIAQREKKSTTNLKKKIKKPHNGNRTNIRNLFFVKGKKTLLALNIYCALCLLQ